MIDRILDALDATDLTRLYVVLSILGALMVVYVMSLTSYEHEDERDPTWLQWVRRCGYLVTASALLWSVVFMVDHNWQPWPPSLLLLFGIIVGCAVRIMAIHFRIRREGRRRAVPSRNTVVTRNY